MRALTVNEWSFVAGGDDEPMQEVVITGKRCNDAWSCMSMEELERFLENSYSPLAPKSGGGGGGGESSRELSANEIEKKLAEAMAQTDEKLRDQAILGLALVALGGAAMAFAPAVLIAGALGFIAKWGIATAGAVLAAGGGWLWTNALDNLDNGG